MLKNLKMLLIFDFKNRTLIFIFSDSHVLINYPRTIEHSLRRYSLFDTRSDSSRKRQRESRKERKEAEKIEKQQEIKRLKNLKKKEIQQKLAQIAQIAGDNVMVPKEVLDTPFDDNEHDVMMNQAFGNDYYNQKETEKPTWEEDIDITDLAKTTGQPESNANFNQNDSDRLQKYLDEYYQLDYEDMVTCF
jgi:protein KRI1